MLILRIEDNRGNSVGICARDITGAVNVETNVNADGRTDEGTYSRTSA